MSNLIPLSMTAVPPTQSQFDTHSHVTWTQMHQDKLSHHNNIDMHHLQAPLIHPYLKAWECYGPTLYMSPFRQMGSLFTGSYPKDL